MKTSHVRGVIAGAFDVIHPGYIHMFKESRKHCDYLTVCLHVDPTANGKMMPILTKEERIEILSSIRFVDEVICYYTEHDLETILQREKYDVRILGIDYKGRSFTGHDLSKKTVFIDRDHGWSATKYKKLISDSLNNKKQKIP